MKKIKDWLGKYKWLLIVSMFLVTIGYFGYLTQNIKHMIANPKPSIMLDKQRNIIINSRPNTISWDDLPSIAQKYITLTSKQKPLEVILFPNDPLKKDIAGFIIKNNIKKAELKDLYPNQLYFGNGLVGIENASEYYFNKKAQDLTDQETIFLLSKIKHHNSNNTKNVKSLLKELETAGLITLSEKKQYTDQLQDLIDQLYNKNTYAHSYIEYGISEAVKELKIPEEDFFRKGYKVYTNLDPKIQHALVSKFRSVEVFSESEMESIIESGMVVVNHKKGELSGLIGGRDYLNSSLNRAYELQRQPASTFKPIIAYGPAIDLGWSPKDKLKDVPMRFGNFKPRNYDYKYRKEVPLKEALIESYNVPSAWLLYKIGFETGLKYIDRFEMFEIDKKDNISLALGFNTIGTSPLSMAKAYTIFSNEGKMASANSIDKIETKSGFTKYKAKNKEKKVIKPDAAKVMRNLLIAVVDEGTGEKAQIPGEKVGGKTGTTSYDAWFVGFNGEYTGAIWMGPDLIAPKNRMDIGGGDSPSTLFKKVFSEIQ